MCFQKCYAQPLSILNWKENFEVTDLSFKHFIMMMQNLRHIALQNNQYNGTT